MGVGTWKVTWKGLRRAASNVFWFPFRAFVFVFKALVAVLTAVITVLLTVLVVLALVLGSVGWYFYAVKSNQPLEIDSRFSIRPPEGMIFRELWQDRFAGWEKIDEQKNERCVSTMRVGFGYGMVLIPTLRIYEVRFRPDSRAARDAVAGIKGMIAPAELPLLDAVWWQIENEMWWFWVTAEKPVQANYCYLPPPK
jgi:hypothetical protein